jgi:dTMP kinase
VKLLIVVDGLDGCGKDAHARRLTDLLEADGHRVVLMSHPSDRWFGRISKKALEGSGHVSRAIATLFYTLDVLASVSRFHRAEDGTFVFVRYLLGTAYLPRRLAPTGYGLFRKLLPFPDLALFIDIDPAVALRRIEMRDHKREMFETIEKLRSVREVASTLTRAEWVTVDNSDDGEAPFKKVAEELLERKILRQPPESPTAPPERA